MPAHQANFEAIGTKWFVDVDSNMSSKDWQSLLDKIHERINVFDKNYSRFRVDSLVTAMSQSSGTYTMPGDGYALFNFYWKLYQATAGLVTPLVGQTVSDAGYDANYSLKPKKLTKPPRWEEVLEFSSEQINLKQPSLLDFGAAGKGYLVDILGDLLKKSGATDFVVNASGDILHYSDNGKLVSVGLENPIEQDQAIGVANLSNKSLCASAGSRRKWGEFTHLINPSTLESPKNVLASWVIANDAMTADGLATALFFCKPQQLSGFDFAYAILEPDMALTYSENFPVKIFKDKE